MLCIHDSDQERYIYMNYTLFEQLGHVKWPLIFSAIISLSIVLERSFFIFRALLQNEIQKHQLICFIGKYKNNTKQIRDEACSVMLGELRGKYYRNLSLLKTIGVIAPMLGLLGTVLGIMQAFHSIALNELDIVTPHIVADGLHQAMTTTVFGLVISIPSIFFSYIFRCSGEHIMDRLYNEMNMISLQFEDNSINIIKNIDNQ